MDKQVIDKLLDMLMDGKWHTAKEITDKTRIEENKARLITSFLREFQFIQEDKKTGRIRLSALTKELFQKLGKTDPNSSYEEITA
jgi:DNA-binding IclR family transcriptional regulator